MSETIFDLNTKFDQSDMSGQSLSFPTKLKNHFLLCVIGYLIKNIEISKI